MVDEYDGTHLVDSGGEHIGVVERTYVDEDGDAQFIKVKLGHIFGKHRLVPADQLERDGEMLQVPYTRDTIEESPHVDPDETLEGAGLDAVRTYYASDLAGTADEDGGDRQAAPVATPVGVGEANDVTATNAIPSPEGATEMAPTRVGENRDAGDTVEAPIVEDVLVKE